MGDYKLQGDTYIIKNYDRLPAFSSFLPGLAGIKGIPLWVFYTNRGQGINSFGIHHKSNAIMEFNPANTAYENTALKGFRTFIKVNGSYFEPFFPGKVKPNRCIYMKPNSFMVEEINEEYGLKIRVKYFVLPNESIGALVRKVEITNISNETMEIEMLDGMPKVIPYGIANGAFKEMSNLLKSWTEIKNTNMNIPFITMRASSDDSAEVAEIEGGYFYLSVANGEILPILYDVDKVFGYDTSLVNPVEFMNKSTREIKTEEGCFYNKVPCCFTASEYKLEANESYSFASYVGFTNSVDEINQKAMDLIKIGYEGEKELIADAMVESFTKDVKTSTAIPTFDKYVEQCYLDNFLRGGYPFVFNKEKNPSVVHLFSRKHGDPERDYNFFAIAGEYYSQGNGNFRDVNQNRRNDVFFNPHVGTFNIKTFFSLIQMDGYNPLEVRPSTFCVKEEKSKEVDAYLAKNVASNGEKLAKLLSRSFTPGQIAKVIASNQIELNISLDELIEGILFYCEEQIEAGFGEGYWSDHWGYNMDLVEDYIKIYPDKLEELLYEDTSYGYYDSAARVLRRSETYVLGNKGVRQYGSLVHDEEKNNKTGFVKNGSNWLKDKNGNKVSSNLMVKLLSLGLIKFATLDPYGMGVEMEGGKPGWNDAMNGIPGLFGSGMAESFELKRVLDFICNHLEEDRELSLPIELGELLLGVNEVLEKFYGKEISEFEYWDKVAALREEFRDKIRFGTEGEYSKVNNVLTIIKRFNQKLHEGIEKAKSYGEVVPTYFTYEATKYTKVLDKDGKVVLSHYGLPKVKVLEFNVIPLPAFLEGPARMLKVMTKKEEAKHIFREVKKSELYDKELKMYKTSVPLDDISMEHGRIRAFTPGWLERESVFLHMEYKYLYGLLKAGLCEEFYEEIKTTFIPFLAPEEYGRSILENSSFIASSRNPNKEVHKRGYVSRLSGSTTELISMWIQMFMGDKVFTCEEGELKLYFEPKLPEYFFDDKDEVSFMLLSNCFVTYRNKKRLATFGEKKGKIVSITVPERDIRVTGNFLYGQLAKEVREGNIRSLLIEIDE